MTASTYVVKRKNGRTPFKSLDGARLEHIDIELTERCNNNCIHCCINRPPGDAPARSREMTNKQVKDILRQAADLGCLQVRLTGGEPLLRTDFEELYIYARRLGMKVMLFTNACLITPELADLFSGMPPLVPIEITVYGMRRESYESVTRSQGSFESFQRGVNLLLERDVPFVVKSVILPQNRLEMEELERWAETLPGINVPPAYVMFLDLRNRRDDAGKNAIIESLRLSPEEVLDLLTRDAGKYRRDSAAFASRFMTPPNDSLFNCGAGQGICIDAYGVAQPCMGMRAPELTVRVIPGKGPGRETEGASTLAEAVARFRQLNRRRAKNPDYLRRCARCFLRGFCEQCPAKSWMEHGNLDTPVEYLCEIAHTQARYLGWVGEKEYGWEVTNWKERIDNASSWEPSGGSVPSRARASG